MKPLKHRDVTYLLMPGGSYLLLACDAAGGIGPKPGDHVKVSGYILGRFTARVALMEVLAAGGSPFALVNTCCTEPEPTGQEILRGILEEAALAGLSDSAVMGSFEKNIPTVQTGLGVTALALAGKAPAGRTAREGDLVVAIGLPKVGEAVRLDDPTIADLPLVIRLAGAPQVHDLLPAGSRGIAAEVQEMAAAAGLTAHLFPPEPGWDLNASAGPATSCLAAIAPGDLPGLALTMERPWAVVAQLHSHLN